MSPIQFLGPDDEPVTGGAWRDWPRSWWGQILLAAVIGGVVGAGLMACYLVGGGSW